MAVIFGQNKGKDPEQERFQREWFDWARAENIESMQFAVDDGQDINEIVMDGLSAASIASLDGKMRLFEWLREKGADFKKFDGHNRTALMCSAHGGTLKIAAKLLSRGDPVTALAVVNSEGRSALHFASLAGRADMVQFLIAKGSDSNLKDSDGNTPLHLSMKGGSPQAVKYLLDAGANPDIQNAKEQTPSKLSGGQAACRAILENGNADAGPSSGFSMISTGGSKP